jgi:hypothetical protein
MINGTPSHGSPESNVFGIIGQVHFTDEGKAYIKQLDDTLNTGWSEIPAPERVQFESLSLTTNSQFGTSSMDSPELRFRLLSGTGIVRVDVVCNTGGYVFTPSRPLWVQFDSASAITTTSGSALSFVTAEFGGGWHSVRASAQSDQKVNLTITITKVGGYGPQFTSAQAYAKIDSSYNMLLQVYNTNQFSTGKARFYDATGNYLPISSNTNYYYDLNGDTVNNYATFAGGGQINCSGGFVPSKVIGFIEIIDFTDTFTAPTNRVPYVYTALRWANNLSLYSNTYTELSATSSITQLKNDNLDFAVVTTNTVSGGPASVSFTSSASPIAGSVQIVIPANSSVSVVSSYNGASGLAAGAPRVLTAASDVGNCNYQQFIYAGAAPTPTPIPPTPTPTPTPVGATPTPTPTPTATPPGPTATPTPTPTPGPTATPTPTPTPTPVPAFHFTSAVFTGWLFGSAVNPAGTGARLPNRYDAGMMMDDPTSGTATQIVVEDDVSSTFANAVTVLVKRNGSTIRTSSGTGPFTYNLTSAESSHNATINVVVSPNVTTDTPKVRTTATITSGPGLFNDSSLRFTAKNWFGGGSGYDATITLSGVPLGCVIPYAGVADHTMGGYAKTWTNTLPVTVLSYVTTMDGTSVDNTIRTNFNPTGTSISFYASRVTSGESDLEIDASVYAPSNPTAPTYALTVSGGDIGVLSTTGTNGSATAGSFAAIDATLNTGYFFSLWSSTGAGVNNTNDITSDASASTTVFIDGPKTLYAYSTL